MKNFAWVTLYSIGMGVLAASTVHWLEGDAWPEAWEWAVPYAVGFWGGALFMPQRR